MSLKRNKTYPLRGAAAAVLVLLLCVSANVIAAELGEQVCEVGADSYLGIEDYQEAIRLHFQVLRAHPENALAHYHLGFAQGMIGDRTAELSQYRQAETLGLRNWDLFLNRGLAQLDLGDLEAATNSLRQAVRLGPDHPESHFNLALVYQQRGTLADAEREVIASLRLDRGQPDARNLLGVIYAQQGDTAHASSIWYELVREMPDFAPARINLLIVGGPSVAATGETAAATPTRRSPSKPSEAAAD